AVLHTIGESRERSIARGGLLARPLPGSLTTPSPRGPPRADRPWLPTCSRPSPLRSPPAGPRRGGAPRRKPVGLDVPRLVVGQPWAQRSSERAGSSARTPIAFQ